MTIHVHPTLAKLVPYSPGKPLEELERELGIPGAVKLASNENPLGPSPKALAALNQGTDTLHRYPDSAAHHLTRALADHLNVSLNQVLVGNGSDEIISLLVKAFVTPGDDCVMADPTFVMYKLAVTGGYGVTKEVPLHAWCHDLPAMARIITDRTRLVFICNPNNPTGSMVTHDDVLTFMAEIPDHVIVVFDEAYYEYVRHSHYPNTIQFVRENRPVVVLRTFSKIYGLAGLRIGYGIMTSEMVDCLHRVRNPFNTNALAQTAALAALRDEAHVTASRQLNESEMAVVESGLRELGFSPLSSQTNFLYFDTGRDGHDLFTSLLKEGVIVRHIRGSMIRVTIGEPKENRQFLRALKKVIAPMTVI